MDVFVAKAIAGHTELGRKPELAAGIDTKLRAALVKVKDAHADDAPAAMRAFMRCLLIQLAMLGGREREAELAGELDGVAGELPCLGPLIDRLGSVALGQLFAFLLARAEPKGESVNADPSDATGSTAAAFAAVKAALGSRLLLVMLETAAAQREHVFIRGGRRVLADTVRKPEQALAATLVGALAAAVAARGGKLVACMAMLGDAPQALQPLLLREEALAAFGMDAGGTPALGAAVGLNRCGSTINLDSSAHWSHAATNGPLGAAAPLRFLSVLAEALARASGRPAAPLLAELAADARLASAAQAEINVLFDQKAVDLLLAGNGSEAGSRIIAAYAEWVAAAAPGCAEILAAAEQLWQLPLLCVEPRGPQPARRELCRSSDGIVYEEEVVRVDSIAALKAAADAAIDEDLKKRGRGARGPVHVGVALASFVDAQSGRKHHSEGGVYLKVVEEEGKPTKLYWGSMVDAELRLSKRTTDIMAGTGDVYARHMSALRAHGRAAVVTSYELFFGMEGLSEDRRKLFEHIGGAYPLQLIFETWLIHEYYLCAQLLNRDANPLSTCGPQRAAPARPLPLCLAHGSGARRRGTRSWLWARCASAHLDRKPTGAVSLDSTLQHSSPPPRPVCPAETVSSANAAPVAVRRCTETLEHATLFLAKAEELFEAAAAPEAAAQEPPPPKRLRTATGTAATETAAAATTAFPKLSEAAQDLAAAAELVGKLLERALAFVRYAALVLARGSELEAMAKSFAALVVAAVARCSQMEQVGARDEVRALVDRLSALATRAAAVLGAGDEQACASGEGGSSSPLDAIGGEGAADGEDDSGRPSLESIMEELTQCPLCLKTFASIQCAMVRALLCQGHASRAAPSARAAQRRGSARTAMTCPLACPVPVGPSVHSRAFPGRRIHHRLCHVRRSTSRRTRTRGRTSATSLAAAKASTIRHLSAYAAGRRARLPAEAARRA